MMSLKSLAFAACLIAAAICPHGSALAKVLVTQATGPSAGKFPPGSILSEPLDIVLASGDRLTVLDQVGTRVLIGPMRLRNGEVRRPTQDRLTALRKLFEDRMRARAAVSRSMDGEQAAAPVATAAAQRSPAAGNLWAVGTTSKGDWCVIDAEAVELWRDQASSKGRVVLTGPSGASHESTWLKGEQSAFWPSEARIAEGSTYQLRYEQDHARFVTFHVIKADDGDLVTLGRELLRNGCGDQLDMLLGDGSWQS